MAMWGIHNDRSDIDPVADGAVRIGWDEMGDLSQYEASREAIKDALAIRLPELEAPSRPSAAGTLYRFVHGVAEGDLVVAPDRRDRTLNIGRVSGPYLHRPGAGIYTHWRPVEWLRTGVSRGELSVAAQHEISSATTLFTVRTAYEEIERLLADPPSASPADFTWAAFYTELADVLLPYRQRRGELLEKLWRVAESSGRSHLFTYLRKDTLEDGSKVPIADIDPFTVMGTFNRGITDAARGDIARAFAGEFDLSSAVPEQFLGVPVLNNLNSWFFRFSHTRREDEVDNLWELAYSAIAYATSPGENSREALVTAFDDCAMGNTRKLTMGLYWIRPHTFAAYDSVNTAYLKEELPDVAASLSLAPKIDGEQFLANTEALTKVLNQDDPRFSTFPELSYSAWMRGSTPVDPDTDDAAAEVEASPATAADQSTVGEVYTLDSIREDGCFVPMFELQTMLERLKSRKNIILQGPPGTGKTWLARRLAWALCEERLSESVVVLQFHPSLSYEDFVRGFRPTSGKGLELVDGPFLDLCERARSDADTDYVMVIEEINRGTPSQIFGELLTLLESDKRSLEYGMRLAYPRPDEDNFFIPQNVHVIGTMNVADRSLAMVDMALRRRFAFLDLEPRLEDEWVEFVSGRGFDRERLETYGARLRRLNQQISDDTALGRHYCVGHSFFTPASTPSAIGLTTEEWWRRVVKTDIAPLLEEYWFDRPSVAEEAITSLLAT